MTLKSNSVPIRYHEGLYNLTFELFKRKFSNFKTVQFWGSLHSEEMGILGFGKDLNKVTLDMLLNAYIEGKFTNLPPGKYHKIAEKMAESAAPVIQDYFNSLTNDQVKQLESIIRDANLDFKVDPSFVAPDNTRVEEPIQPQPRQTTYSPRGTSCGCD